MFDSFIVHCTSTGSDAVDGLTPAYQYLSGLLTTPSSDAGKYDNTCTSDGLGEPL